MRRLQERCARQQGGYVLASVIAMLGLIALVGTAMFTMTVTAMKVTETFRDSLDDVSVSDSALDLVVHDLRRQPDPLNLEDCDPDRTYQRTITFPDGESTVVDVTCTGSSSTGPDTRSIKLEAAPQGSSGPRARASIRITDEHESEARPGFKLEICDWQLGDHVAPSVPLDDTGSMASCPP